MVLLFANHIHLSQWSQRFTAASVFHMKLLVHVQDQTCSKLAAAQYNTRTGNLEKKWSM